MKSETVFIHTDDNWYGTFADSTVELSYIGKLAGGEFRVACWGNDDFGLEKDFGTEEEAVEVFNSLKELKSLNKADLINIGFTQA